jgi:hypothetical protein
MNRHGQFRVVQTLFLYISWIDVNGYVQYCRILHTYPISRVHKRDPITSNIFKNKSWALIELLYLHKRLKVNRKQTSQLGRIEASEFSYVMQHNVRRWQQTKRHALAEGKERKKKFSRYTKRKVKNWHEQLVSVNQAEVGVQLTGPLGRCSALYTFSLPIATATTTTTTSDVYTRKKIKYINPPLIHNMAWLRAVAELQEGGGGQKGNDDREKTTAVSINESLLLLRQRGIDQIAPVAHSVSPSAVQSTCKCQW